VGHELPNELNVAFVIGLTKISASRGLEISALSIRISDSNRLSEEEDLDKVGALRLNL
jgi:hypothetical protein